MKSKLLLSIMTITAVAGVTIAIVDNLEEADKSQPPIRVEEDSTQFDMEKIKYSLNTLSMYKVYEGTVPVEHKMHYDKDNGFDLFDNHIIVSGEAKCYFEYFVNLSEVELKDSNGKIIISVPRAVLDGKSVKRTSEIKFNEDESYHNLVSNFGNSKRDAQAKWEESFEESCVSEILEMEDTDAIDNYTKRAVSLLVQNLGFEEGSFDIVITEK